MSKSGGFDLKILQIGWANTSVSAQIKDGASKYTSEVLKELDGNMSVYYERISGIKSHIKALLMIPKYYKQDIDVVHVLGNGLHGLIGILLSKLLRKPLAVTLYAHSPDERRTLHRSAITSLIPILLEWIATNVAEAVIVTSKWQKRRLGGRVRAKAIVVYPGINQTGMRGYPEKIDSAVCITGSLSRNDRAFRKGVDLIAEIAELTPEVTFHIAGGTSDQIKSILKKVPSNMIFHGYLDGEHLQRLLSKSKFIIAPSRHEAFSISVLEGMGFGCIPIISEYCGIQDIIKDCGFVLPLNPELFSKSLVELLKAVETAEKMSAQSVKISKNFTWKQTADKHAKIYQALKILNKKSMAPPRAHKA